MKKKSFPNKIFSGMKMKDEIKIIAIYWTIAFILFFVIDVIAIDELSLFCFTIGFLGDFWIGLGSRVKKKKTKRKNFSIKYPQKKKIR